MVHIQCSTDLTEYYCYHHHHAFRCRPITLEERGKNETTIGKFVRQILTENNFLSARFPRIPVLIEKVRVHDCPFVPFIVLVRDFE